MRIFVFLLSIIIAHSAFAFFRTVPETKAEMVHSFAPLVKQVSPAVVNIYTKRKVKVRSVSPFFNDPLFRNFFGGRFAGREKERIERSLGSGVIVRQDGYVITSHHVIKDSEEITVILADRREFDAKMVILDEKTDLALLKMETEGENLPIVPLVDSDTSEVGDIVLAIGNPFGVGQTVTSGIISAVARTTVGVSDYQFFIQTDAAINPGNSGGALVNMKGELLGINTAIYTRSGGSNGIGFAIPSNMVETVIQSGIGGNKVVRPWLGLSTQVVTQDVASSLGLKHPQGALVAEVYAGGPVARAGIKVGDVITGVDKHKVVDQHELHFRIATYKIGSNVAFKVFRGGKHYVFNVKMEAAPEKPTRDLRHLRGDHPFDGAVVANLSPALAHEIGLSHEEKGVVVMEVKPGVAARTGFKPKDIVVTINGQNIEHTKALEALLKKGATRWQVAVQRGDRVLTIILGR